MRLIPVYTPLLRAEDGQAVEAAIRSGHVSGASPVVSDFERVWGARCGMPNAVAVANGTAALELAVRALGLGPRDEVLCPSFTIISCARAIVAAGATPVLVDVDADTYCLDVEACRERIGPRTRAVLGVHMYGHPYPHEALSELARAHGLLVIEDAAQAHGARVRQGSDFVPCGSLGDASTFSFYANKPVTTGEGGMVLTRDRGVAERVRALSNLGFLPGRRFVHEELAPNYRLSSLQAALGLSQIDGLERVLEIKRALAAEYRARLRSVEELELQATAAWAEPIFWMNAGVLRDSVRTDAREIAASLLRKGVETRPFFVGMHEQPALHALGYFAGERYPVTERLSRRGFYLPSGLDLTVDDVEYVASALKDAFALARTSAVVPETPRGRLGETAPSGDGLPFGAVYASAYDALYAEKSYADEARVLKACFERHAVAPVRRVLDLGCGTGAHALELGRLGYDVTGVDRSPSMLAVARGRLGSGAKLVESDLLDVALGETFDAVTILFAVLSYQTTLEGTLAALRAARRHLEPGGLLVLDAWYGPAVVRSPPRPRVKRALQGDVEWTRSASAEHDPNTQTVTVSYELSRKGSGTEERVRETHPMHYFFPHELRLALEMTGFELLALTEFSDLGGPPSLDDYTVLVIAAARPL